MNIQQRPGILAKHGTQRPTLIILHDTVSGNRKGTEEYLKRGEPGRRGLGYHFMIDRDGEVYQYAKVTDLMWHAAGFNKGSVGIAFIGGGKYGEVNDAQWQSCIELIRSHIVYQAPGIRAVSGHKHCSRSGKVDPRFPGEPPGNVDWGIDRFYMQQLADEVGLAFVTPVK